MQYPGKAITDRYPSRMLCGKRYDNAFPFASSSMGTPRTCFEDVILSPLASWIFLLALLAFVAYSLSSRGSTSHNGRTSLHKLIHRSQPSSSSDAVHLQASDKEAEEASEQRTSAATNPSSTSFTSRWPKLMTFFSILYSLLVLATLLMNVLETVRLYLADRGAGLLPFNLASILLVLILMHLPLPAHLRPATGLVILVFWLCSLVFTSVKLATLSKLQDVESRAGTEYLDSDQIIDLSVIVALYALEVIVESWRLARMHKMRQ